MKNHNFTSNHLPELSALSEAQQERVKTLQQNINKKTNKPYVTDSQAICIALLTDSSFLSEVCDDKEKARIKNYLFCAHLINSDCYKKIGKDIRNFCVSECGFRYRGVGTDDIAEDVLQECLLKSFDKLDKFEGKASITTWIVSYAAITLKEQLRIIKNHSLFGTIPIDSLEEKTITPLNSEELPDDPEKIVTRDEFCSIRRDVLAKASETISSQDRRGKILTIWLKYANLDQIRKIKRARNEEKEAEGEVTLQQIADEYNQDPSNLNLDKIDHNKVKRAIEEFQKELRERCEKATGKKPMESHRRRIN